MCVREYFTYHSLEARVQLCEEGGLVLLRQDSLLHHGTFHVIVLDHHVLLQDLDGVQLLRRLHLREHHLRVDEEGTGQRSQGNTRDGGRILKRQKKCFYVFMSLRARRSPCRSFPSPAGTGSWSRSVGCGPCYLMAGWTAGGPMAWSLSYRGPAWLSVVCKVESAIKVNSIFNMYL